MAQPVGAKGEVRVEQPDRVQRTIARRSAEARATIPDLELSAEVELGAAPAPATGTLVRACALALREFPRANASSHRFSSKPTNVTPSPITNGRLIRLEFK